jgi:hypothetical protein
MDHKMYAVCIQCEIRRWRPLYISLDNDNHGLTKTLGIDELTNDSDEHTRCGNKETGFML